MKTFIVEQLTYYREKCRVKATTKKEALRISIEGFYPNGNIPEWIDLSKDGNGEFQDIKEVEE